MSNPRFFFYITLCIYLLSLVIKSKGIKLEVQNMPPVFNFKREWIIKEDEALGSQITTVRTKDEDKDEIVYGIEPSLFSDGSKFFSINSKTGEVFLKSSVKGQAGKNYYLLITANDGHHTSKIEVFIRIVDRVDLNLSSDVISNFNIATKHFSGSSFVSHFPSLTFPKSNHPLFSKFDITTDRQNLPTVQVSSSSLSSLFFESTLPSISSSRTPPSIPNFIDQVEKRNKLNVDLSYLEPLNSLEESLEKNENTSKNFQNKIRHKVQMINSFIPLFAVIIFAPIAGLVFFLMYRRSDYNLKKFPNLSKKLRTTKKSKSFHSSIGSLSICSNFRQNYIPPKFDPKSTLMKDIDKWEFPRHHLRILSLLGEGCFGRVWKCEAYNIGGTEGASIVAVKTIKETASEKERKDLTSEMEILKSLDPHPNIVTLLGCCSDEPQFLILEYVPFGTLQAYLRENRADKYFGNILGSLTARDLTSFVYQIAKGMEYISSKWIIHRDLAARNILIGNNKICKITDFGFSRNLKLTQVYEKKSEGRLPIRWMPPEALYENKFTIKGDVWSFGILIWEIVTLGSTPYPGLATKEVMKKVKEGYRLEKPDHCKREMYNIMYYCWDSNPKERPSFTELIKLLDKLIISENDYIELDRFPDHSYYNVLTYLSGEKL